MSRKTKTDEKRPESHERADRLLTDFVPYLLDYNELVREAVRRFDFAGVESRTEGEVADDIERAADRIINQFQPNRELTMREFVMRTHLLRLVHSCRFASVTDIASWVQHVLDNPEKYEDEPVNLERSS